MGRRAKDLTASEVVAEREDAECTGFFDRRDSDNQRRCVVLAVSEQRPRLVGVEEFIAPTAEVLVAKAHEVGWELGEPERVEELCRPVWSGLGDEKPNR